MYQTALLVLIVGRGVFGSSIRRMGPSATAGGGRRTETNE